MPIPDIDLDTNLEKASFSLANGKIITTFTSQNLNNLFRLEENIWTENVVEYRRVSVFPLRYCDSQLLTVKNLEKKRLKTY